MERMKKILGLISTVLVVFFGILYLIYFSIAVKTSRGIYNSSLIIFVIFYIISVTFLTISTCYYSYKMKKLWGSAFEDAIRRVTYITFVLVLG